MEDMESKILSSLSQDYLNLLESEKCSDVIINVGKNPNVKKFNAHSLILHTRSPYFRAALSKEWVCKQDDDKMIFNKPNISPEVFDVILKQVLSRIFFLNQVNYTYVCMCVVCVCIILIII